MMQVKTVDDIFETKRKIRTRLLDLLSDVPETEAASAIDGERWSIAQIVEHVAAVDESSIRVCAKLLSKAQADNDVSDGSATISVSFNSKADEIGTMKVEAPEIVQPKIGSTLAASIAKLNQTARRFEELKLLFRTFDGTKRKFPHPFFAEISAHEWLLLSGLHEEGTLDRSKDYWKIKKARLRRRGCNREMSPNNSPTRINGI